MVCRRTVVIYLRMSCLDEEGDGDGGGGCEATTHSQANEQLFQV